MSKYYAVRKGYNPGIYDSWVECEKQVKGFKGAEFRSFDDFETAELYFNGNEIEPKKPHNENKQKEHKNFYLVISGLNSGIYTSWEECQKQVIGVSNSKFKGFYTFEELEKYILELEKQETELKYILYEEINKREFAERLFALNEALPFMNEKNKEVSNELLYDNDICIDPKDNRINDHDIDNEESLQPDEELTHYQRYWIDFYYTLEKQVEFIEVAQKYNIDITAFNINEHLSLYKMWLDDETILQDYNEETFQSEDSEIESNHEIII